MLVWTFVIGAILCLAYFIVLIYHAGITSSFVFFWLISAVFLFSISQIVRILLRETQRQFLWFPVSLVTLCMTGATIILVMQVIIVGQVPAIAKPNLDYVIVLGAGVRDGNISTTLKHRLDKTLEYATQNPETKIVLSGGSTAENKNPESFYMYEYLRAAGVPAEQMIQETRAISTVENIAYSKLLMEEKSEVGIISSNFHLFRAGLIAGKQGLTDVYKIGAPSDPILFFHHCVRDAIAIVKDRLMGNL